MVMTWRRSESRSCPLMSLIPLTMSTLKRILKNPQEKKIYFTVFKVHVKEEYIKKYVNKYISANVY